METTSNLTMSQKEILKTRVLIIDGGATGTGLARDLALRGVPCIIAEKGDKSR
jgi:glycerol-3-phosphate dehydrogenase